MNAFGKGWDLKTSAKKLKQLRRERVLSQRELAREAGVTGGTVIRLEHGQPEARPGTIRRLASALGVEPVELLADGNEYGGTHD